MMQNEREMWERESAVFTHAAGLSSLWLYPPAPDVAPFSFLSLSLTLLSNLSLVLVSITCHSFSFFSFSSTSDPPSPPLKVSLIKTTALTRPTWRLFIGFVSIITKRLAKDEGEKLKGDGGGVVDWRGLSVRKRGEGQTLGVARSLHQRRFEGSSSSSRRRLRRPAEANSWCRKCSVLSNTETVSVMINLWLIYSQNIFSIIWFIQHVGCLDCLSDQSRLILALLCSYCVMVTGSQKRDKNMKLKLQLIQ